MGEKKNTTLMGSPIEQSDTPMAHVFMISFPSQGHINPLLRLGKRLASKGLLVTFSTTATSGQVIRSANDGISDEDIPVGDGFIRFEFFQDGWSEHDRRREDMDIFSRLDSVGRKQLPEMLARQAREGRPVSCLINSPCIPCVSDVADDLGIPSAMLWVQSCASFLAHYYHSHSLVPFPDENAPDIDVQIPSMPLLKWDEIPSFLHPATAPYGSLRRAMLEQFQNLSKPFCVLAETFYELEAEMVDHISTLCGPMRPIGPLFKDPKPVSGSSRIRADPMKADQECIGWLDRKPTGSVVYISFGTVVNLKEEQVDEIAAALSAAGVAFLWVMKPPHQDKLFTPHKLFPEGFFEKVGDNGKVVQFSPQEQVLAHPALACFMTHCGWNSTMEALTSGVPVVAFPQWGDQVTDAKFLCDVFGVGLRLSRGEFEDRVIPREEVEKCLREATSGPRAAELKQNALKWKAAAERAVAEGGSSDQNLQAFVDEIRKRSKIMFGDANNKCSGN